MEPYDEGFAGFTDPATAGLYGQPVQDGGYYGGGSDDASYQDASFATDVAKSIAYGVAGNAAYDTLKAAPGYLQSSAYNYNSQVDINGLIDDTNNNLAQDPNYYNFIGD